jgi:acylphosphatase
MFETRIRIRLERDGKKLSLQGWVRNLGESCSCTGNRVRISVHGVEH